jgi:hypothetical protein
VIAQYLLAGTLILLGGYLSLFNWAALISSLVTRRFTSGVPLFGAGFLAAGAALVPTLRPYAWAAILIDWGTLSFLVALPWIAWSMFSTSHFTLVEEYAASKEKLKVRMRLFQRGICTIRWDVERNPGEFGIASAGREGTWKRENESLIITIGQDNLVFTTSSESGAIVLRQSVASEYQRSDAQPSLEGVELQRRPR